MVNETTEFHQVQFTEKHTHRIDGETREFKEGEKVSMEKTISSMLVNRSGVAQYTGKSHEVEDADTRVIKGETEDTGTEDEKVESFEDIADENTAKEVIGKVEEVENVSWLENLRNYDERKTVKEAIDEKLDELQNDEDEESEEE